MDDINKITGPTTRKSNRLSVESDNVSSPATPTKKKPARVATKPLLENIKEDTPVSSPKPSRRRSTARDLDDERPLTPSRRSARIRSNTSRILETSQVIESPRAKRATRRNSLIGSDNEGPSTPVKTTRPARKDSTSSIDNIGEPVAAKQIIKDAIIEEPENQAETSSPNNDSENTSPNTRRSPRLAKRISKKSGDFATEDENINRMPKELNNKLNKTPEVNDIKTVKLKLDDSKTENEELNKSASHISLPKVVVTPNENMRKNRTASLMEQFASTNNSKRQRTKSWTTISNDKEDSKKLNKSLNTTLDTKSTGDFFFNKTEDDNKEENTGKMPDKVNNYETTHVPETTTVESSDSNQSFNLLKITKLENVQCQVNIEDSDSNPESHTGNDNATNALFFEDKQGSVENNVEIKENREIFFEYKIIDHSGDDSCEPMDVDETLSETVNQNELIKKSLSNISLTNSMVSTENVNDRSTAKDISLNRSKKRKLSLSKIVENLSSASKPDKNTKNITTNDSANIVETDSFKASDDTNIGEYKDSKTLDNAKSHITFDDTNLNASNKKNKSSSSLTNKKTLDDFANENKSTLILSNFNDSVNVSNNTSVKDPLETTTLLDHHKKQNLSDIQDNTPLRNKNIKGLGLQTSTPVIADQKGKKSKKPEISEINESVSSESESAESEDSEHDEPSNDDVTKGMFVDEAEDAGEHYQSGDSEDENESSDDQASEKDKNDISLQPISKINVDENNSMSKIENITTDPLQEKDDSSSLCSENLDIMKDYDSILNNLNDKTKKIKTHTNTSLNINNKLKPKTNTLVDQLNLTQTKNRKKVDNKQNHEDKDDQLKVIKKPLSNEEFDSSSLDIQLLFSDSNSNDSVPKKKDDDSNDCIPLKRSFGNTNLHDESGSSMLSNGSTKKVKNNSANTSSSTMDLELNHSLIYGSHKTNSSKKNKKLSGAIANGISNDPKDDSTEEAKNTNLTADMGKNKKRKYSEVQDDIINLEVSNSHDSEKSQSKNLEESSTITNREPQPRKNKRKAMDDEDIGNKNKKSKILKDNRLDNVPIPRLPPSFLRQLNETSVKSFAEKPSKVVSTSNFVIEETVKRKNKPSQYLEQSINLDSDSPDKVLPKKLAPLPKVLPFVPTAVTSSQGFTTRFQISVLPKETKFTAQNSNVNNFKNDYLFGKNIKRMGTYALYKKNRNNKLAKF